MSHTKGRKIVLELSEHDALQILTLVKKEINRADKIWQPYWETQARNIQLFIEKASLVQRSIWPEDIFSNDEVDDDLVGPLKLKGSI
jgi:hypothetical protein